MQILDILVSTILCLRYDRVMPGINLPPGGNSLNLSPGGYKEPLIYQYIYHIKLGTLRLCIKFQNVPRIQSIILLGHF